MGSFIDKTKMRFIAISRRVLQQETRAEMPERNKTLVLAVLFGFNNRGGDPVLPDFQAKRIYPLVGVFKHEELSPGFGVSYRKDHPSMQGPSLGRRTVPRFLSVTTAVPTILKLRPEGVMLNVNMRQQVGVTEGDIDRAFEKLSEEYSFSFQVRGCEDGVITDENLPFLQRMKDVSEAYGLDAGFKMAAGSSYAKTMENFVSWGPNPPYEYNTAHMQDEKISMDTILLATKIYACYIALEASI